MTQEKAAYHKLESLFKKKSVLSGASAILHWDNAVMMPDGGAEARAEQLATLGLLTHEILTSSEISDLLNEAEGSVAGLSEWEAANLKEMRHEWRHENCLESDLVEAMSLATSKCELTWRQAREECNFSLLQGELGEVVKLNQKMAKAKADVFGCSDYDALLDQFEPGCKSADIDILFDDLQEFLPGFLDKVLEKQSAYEVTQPEGPFSIDVQKELGLEFMKALTFDFDRGRLDVSHHPFTGGIPDDVRLTTRYVTSDFTQSLMGTLHETGHALYEQNLPKEWRHQPVGNARGMAMHESQSLLVEMQLSRGEEFLSYALPLIRKAFKGEGEDWSDLNLTRLYHKVERGFIRVDADEVTYPLHVILRYRLEQALLSGDLLVQDLPAAWNEGMKDLLGLTPPDDALGCLQDIHWPGGAIGYFPTYTLGALAAAQIFETANDVLPDLKTQITQGEFGPLITWLKANVHQQASLKSTNAMLKEATGSELKADAFKKHLANRYLNA